jgi:hypothetical protein
MSNRAPLLLVIFTAFVAGIFAGPHLGKANAGPTFVGGDPVHWFITNSEDGRRLYTWHVSSRGAVTKFSEYWVDEGERGCPSLRSRELQREQGGQGESAK